MVYVGGDPRRHNEEGTVEQGRRKVLRTESERAVGSVLLGTL